MLATMRIAVIGAGASGLVATWLLQPNYDVTCFEASNDLGGNAQKRIVHVGGESLSVQLGPTFMMPKDYSAFFKILSILEVPSERTPMQLSVLDDQGRAHFISPSLHPFRLGSLSNLTSTKDLYYLRAILNETLKLAKKSDKSTTWHDFIPFLDLPKDFIHSVAYPIVSGFFGLNYETASQISAYCALLYMALCLPTLSNGVQFARSVVGGTHRWIEALGDRLRVGTVQLDCPVTRIKPLPGGKVILEHAQGEEIFDHVVVTTQPWSAAEFIDDEEIVRALQKFPSLPAEIAIHPDPLVPVANKAWSPAMIFAGTESSQLSTFAGSLGGQKLYRSWITEGTKTPKSILAHHTFRHLVPLPEVVDAQRSIQSINAKGSIHFAGAWTHDLDSHEAAIRSGIGAAKALGANNLLLSKIGSPTARYGFGVKEA